MPESSIGNDTAAPLIPAWQNQTGSGSLVKQRSDGSMNNKHDNMQRYEVPELYNWVHHKSNDSLNTVAYNQRYKRQRRKETNLRRMVRPRSSGGIRNVTAGDEQPGYLSTYNANVPENYMSGPIVLPVPKKGNYLHKIGSSKIGQQSSYTNTKYGSNYGADSYGSVPPNFSRGYSCSVGSLTSEHKTRTPKKPISVSGMEPQRDSHWPSRVSDESNYLGYGPNSSKSFEETGSDQEATTGRSKKLTSISFDLVIDCCKDLKNCHETGKVSLVEQQMCTDKHEVGTSSIMNRQTNEINNVVSESNVPSVPSTDATTGTGGLGHHTSSENISSSTNCNNSRVQTTYIGPLNRFNGDISGSPSLGEDGLVHSIDTPFDMANSNFSPNFYGPKLSMAGLSGMTNPYMSFDYSPNDFSPNMQTFNVNSGSACYGGLSNNNNNNNTTMNHQNTPTIPQRNGGVTVYYLKEIDCNQNYKSDMNQDRSKDEESSNPFLSGGCEREPRPELLRAIDSVNAVWNNFDAVNCATLDKTPIEVVVGRDLNEFHVGLVENVLKHEEAINLNLFDVEVGKKMDDISHNDHQWMRVKFDHWGTMNVPSIRCRESDQPYPFTLGRKGAGHSPTEKADKETLNNQKINNKLDIMLNSGSSDGNLTTPIINKTDDLSTTTSEAAQSPNQGQSSISPPQWTPSFSGQRRMVLQTFEIGDEVEIFIPATTDEPPKWVKSRVISNIYEDPRIVLMHGLDIEIPSNLSLRSTSPRSIVTPAELDRDEEYKVIESWHCAKYWGGYCQCTMNQDSLPCLGLKGGYIMKKNFPFYYEVELPIMNEHKLFVVPWQFVRQCNKVGGLVAHDILINEFALPAFLTNTPMSALTLASLDEETKTMKALPSSPVALSDGNAVKVVTEPSEEKPWIESSHSTKLLNQIRHYSKILNYTVHRDETDGYRIIFLGIGGSTVEAQTYLQSEVAHIKSSIEFFERREKRLKILEERKSRYERTEQLEFEADDSLVGLLIGKQGEHLSRVAKAYKVEIRVLPDDEGYRRVRIYGTMPAIQKAKNDLSYGFKYIKIDQEVHKQLIDRRGNLLREASSKYGLNSIWVDVGNPDDKLGVREATVMNAALQAALHPIKSRDIIRGTTNDPVLVLCGVEREINNIVSKLDRYMQFPIPRSILLHEYLEISRHGQSNNTWHSYQNDNRNNMHTNSKWINTAHNFNGRGYVPVRHSNNKRNHIPAGHTKQDRNGYST